MRILLARMHARRRFPLFVSSSPICLSLCLFCPPTSSAVIPTHRKSAHTPTTDGYENRLNLLSGAYEADDEPQIQRFRQRNLGGSDQFDTAEQQASNGGDLGFLDASTRAQIPFLDVLLGAIMNKFLGLTVKQVTDKFTNIVSGEVLGRVIGAVGWFHPVLRCSGLSLFRLNNLHARQSCSTNNIQVIGCGTSSRMHSCIE